MVSIRGLFESAYRQYMRDHKKIYGERRDKYPSLMGMATLARKKLKGSESLMILKNQKRSMPALL